MIDLSEYIHSEHIFYDVDPKDKDDLLKQMVKKVGKLEGLSSTRTLLSKVKEREDLESTGIGRGFAIPHCHLKTFEGVKVYVAMLAEPIDFASIDGADVRTVFLIISGDKDNEQYLRILSSIIYMIKQNDVRDRLVNSRNAEEIIDTIAQLKQEEQFHYSEQLKNLMELERIDNELSTYKQEKSLSDSVFPHDKGLDEQLVNQRKELQAKTDRRAYGIYRNLKNRYGNGFIVKLKGNFCGGCNIKVPVHIIREIRRGMQIIQCESCARILYLPSAIKSKDVN